MTKELEAFVNEVKRAQSDYKKMSTRDKRQWPLEGSVSTITFKYLYTLEKDLTPPTSDEVCEEIEKWRKSEGFANAKIVYIPQFHTFQDVSGREEIETLCGCRNGKVSFCGCFILSPHLVSLIGRFYESLEAKKK